MATFTFDSLTDAGTDLGHSRWIEIDQQRIDTFAEITADRQWIHVDPERAAQSAFGSTIAQGYLTLSLVAGFLDEIFHLEEVGMAVNYGTNLVRFPHPRLGGCEPAALATESFPCCPPGPSAAAMGRRTSA